MNLQRKAMKLVVMTKPAFFVEEDEILTAMFDEGMDCLHLSKPHDSSVYHERLLSLLHEGILRKTVVHEHYFLKDEYNLYGIHVRGSGVPLPPGYRGRFCRSCTELEKLREAKKKAEYVLLENVCDGTCADGEAARFTEKQLEDAADKGLIDKHVYASGGMTLDRIRMMRDLGFGGIVFCNDLWSRFDIHRQRDYKELIAHFRKLRQAVG